MIVMTIPRGARRSKQIRRDRSFRFERYERWAGCRARRGRARPGSMWGSAAARVDHLAAGIGQSGLVLGEAGAHLVDLADMGRAEPHRVGTAVDLVLAAGRLRRGRGAERHG